MLKFTPLEFETRLVAISLILSLKLKFTPLEFETFAAEVIPPCDEG